MAQEPSAAETRAALNQRRDQLLGDLVQAVDDLEAARQRIYQAVDDLRLLKLATWEDIGKALGISGQAAYQRYGKRVSGRSF